MVSEVSVPAIQPSRITDEIGLEALSLARQGIRLRYQSRYGMAGLPGIVP